MDSLVTLGRHAETIVLVLISAIGAALGYISRQWRAGKTIRTSRMVFAMLASTFMMVLTSAVCRILGLSYDWTLVTVGLLSWLGTDVSLAILQQFVYKRLGISQVYVKTGANTPGVNSLKPGGVYSLEELQQNGLGALEYQGTFSDLARELTATGGQSGYGPKASTEPAKPDERIPGEY